MLSWARKGDSAESYEEGGNPTMATDEGTQRSLGSATIISRRRFLKQTALATAVASVPYLAGRSAAFGKEQAKRADAALDRALKELVAMEGGPPGVIAVVQRGKQRKVHTFGVRNIKSGLPIRVDDRMRIASTSKAFSGAVALSLVSKGVLSLDDTIAEHLSDLPDPPPDTWSEVTLRQLLNHTSGLPDYTDRDSEFRNAVIANPTHPDPPEKLITYAYDLNNGDLLFPPGTQYKYSNSDNIAVGLMVEDATGRTYESQLQEVVYEPLGLRRTTLPAGANLRKPFIHGYNVSPPPPPEDVSEDFAAGWAWASGGIVSTPADLNIFIRAYVKGQLYDRETRREQRQVIEAGHSDPPGPGQNSAGPGVFRYETRCGTVWGHTGNIAGYTQFMAASPDGKRSATVSISTPLSPPSTGDQDAFKAFRRAEGRAVCAALAG
jgi:D-alanyl-D-alanine carboxypeptidase